MSTLAWGETKTVVGGFGKIGTYWGVEPMVVPAAPPSPLPPTAAAAAAVSDAVVEAAGSGGSGLPVSVAQARRKSRSCGRRAHCGVINGRIPTQITW